jgi:hypothetical protein
MISRAEFAELFREDDRQRASHAEWMAQREAQAQALVQKSEADDLQYRTHDPNASPPVLYEDGAPVYEEPWAFDEVQMDTLAQVLAHEANRTRAELSEALAKRDRKIAALQEQVAGLRGTVDALLGLRNGNTSLSSGESEVIDLPRNFWRRRDAA